VNSIRRWILAGFVLLVSCEPAHTPFIRDGLERGQDRTEQWITEATRPDVAAATAISLGYLERLRLGLGSPFRLADQALHDPRLDEENRRDVAWAILSRTLDREAYIVEPAVLDGIAPDAHMAKLHLRFIEDAIRSAPHPRAGELAVRMAYTRAARNGMVSEAIPAVTARVAALFRDRELAMADVSRLLVAAADSAFDPLSRISDWRVERRFAVEAPLVSRATPETERAATAQAERMIPLISQLAANDAQETRAVARSSLLQPFSALRLANLTRSANLPPQAPVAVSVAAERAFVLDDPSSGADARAGRERFVENAVSEEAFAAEYALPGRAPHGGAMARTALSVAVALRAYAQEPVWFPGFPAPDAEQLAAAHGLVEVRFAADIPDSWQPYYLRMIDGALVDLRSVLPALDLGGLRINVSRAGIRDGMLALHDPRRRRLILPPESGAGTIAHEIAHDIDGQVALVRYGVRGDYASDGAVRSPRDPLALRLIDLARASDDPDAIREASKHDQRPAEIFARNVEWLVAAALAERGVSNGYLTSIQDDVLTGYGSARPPRAITAEALVLVLDEVAPLDRATRDAFLARYATIGVDTAHVETTSTPRSRFALEQTTPLRPPIPVIRSAPPLHRERPAVLLHNRPSDRE
jgi:hypothetical protein